MTQHSEERLTQTEGAPSVRTGARILPFERPQSELQRAIQQRAQETIDLNLERDREKRRPQPLKWVAIFALACIPVALTLGAVNGFLKVFHQVTATFSSAPAPDAQDQQVPDEPVQTTPGVVMLEAYEVPRAAEPGVTAPAASDPSAQAPSPQ